MECDPNDKDQHEGGAKLDMGKPRAGLILDFHRALRCVAEVSTFGAEKYCEGGWLSVVRGKSRYTDALLRHLLAEKCEYIDPDSGLPHAAHAAWNALARLEFILKEYDNETNVK